MTGCTYRSCNTCGARNGECLATCVICGHVECGGTGRWAVHFTTDTTPVCKGACWRAYEGARVAKETEEMWKAAFARWARQAS